MNRHLFIREIEQPNASDGVLKEMALHRPVIDRVVERRHDHGLIEHQPAMAYRASDWTDCVIKASIGAVDVGVEGPQLDNVRIGRMRQNWEGKERRMRRYRILGGAGPTL